MAFKLIVCICLVGIILNSAYGAPRSIKSEQDLVRSFAEFLEQDKELAQALHSGLGAEGPAHTRHARQAEEETEFGTDQDVENGDQKPGFFDRAAKFVMEVLQRFLKWVNQDN